MMPPSTSLTPFATSLLTWFTGQGRHNLPWQRNPTPYRVWVSEIMLQQTQVQTVLDYYERFMITFPDVQTLASARVDDVLHLWSGLGYYSRGRNLHHSAQVIVEKHDGELPDSLEALRALPGIGRSTAGAILALSHHKRHPILDGNVKRVLSRYHAITGWSGSTTVEKKLWALAEIHTPDEKQVAAYTQAIMDLGASVCRRSNPHCLICPVTKYCLARREGLEATLPERKPQRPIAHRKIHFLIIQNPAGEVLLERRAPVGIWGGLWSFPEQDKAHGVLHWLAERGLGDAVQIPFMPVEHGFSHYRLTIYPTLIKGALIPCVQDRDTLWYHLNDPNPPVGLAAPVIRLINLLRHLDDNGEHLGKNREMRKIGP